MKKIFKLMCIFALLGFLASCAPAATPVATASPAPTATMIPDTYSVQLTQWAGNTMGSGAFYFELSVIQKTDGSGEYKTPDEARTHIIEAVGDIPRECSHASSSEETSFYMSSDNATGCWDTVKTATGMEPDTRVMPDVMDKLKAANDDAATGDFLYINEDGQILGHADINYDGSRGCEIKSLEYIGWSVGEPLLVVARTQAVRDILYDAALWSYNQYGEEVPDFCDENLMTESETPAWINVGHTNDMYSYVFDTLRVEVHTDPNQCDVYTWDNPDEYYVVASAKDIGSLSTYVTDGDLIMLESSEDVVYVGFSNSQPHYYTNTAEYPLFATVISSSYCDGPDACIFANHDRWERLPYMTEDGVVFDQRSAE